jgi:hypothetical protein
VLHQLDHVPVGVADEDRADALETVAAGDGHAQAFEQCLGLLDGVDMQRDMGVTGIFVVHIHQDIFIGHRPRRSQQVKHQPAGMPHDGRVAVLEAGIGHQLVTEPFIEGDRPVLVAGPYADMVDLYDIQHGFLQKSGQ